MLVVVPLDNKGGDPRAGRVQTGNGLGRYKGQYFKVRNNDSENGLSLLIDVIRMHGHLMLLDALHMADGVNEP